MHSEASAAAPVEHGELRNFRHRVIVAGSRGYNDYHEFSQYMRDYLESQIPANESVVFISGKARTGADDLIIRWCQENCYPWAEFPANWDDLEAPEAVIKYNRRGKPYNANAGFARNKEMGDIGTNLIVFWDGHSPGTRQMRDYAIAKRLRVLTILVDVEKETNHAGQQKSSGSDHSGVR